MMRENIHRLPPARPALGVEPPDHGGELWPLVRARRSAAEPRVQAEKPEAPETTRR